MTELEKLKKENEILKQKLVEKELTCNKFIYCHICGLQKGFDVFGRGKCIHCGI